MVTAAVAKAMVSDGDDWCCLIVVVLVAAAAKTAVDGHDVHFDDRRAQLHAPLDSLIFINFIFKFVGIYFTKPLDLSLALWLAHWRGRSRA